MESLMKINTYSGSAFVHSALVVIFYLNNASAQTDILNDKSVYVWDFATRDSKTNTLTTSFTEEFEEALIKSRQCRVLERRNYARLFAQKENENGILNLEQISKSKIENLKFLQAEVVIFGEIFDDTDGGHLKISVSVQDFQANILAKESILLSRGKRYDVESRQDAMKKLVKQLASSQKITSPTLSIQTINNIIAENASYYRVQVMTYSNLDRDVFVRSMSFNWLYAMVMCDCPEGPCSHLYTLTEDIFIQTVQSDSQNKTIEFTTPVFPKEKSFEGFHYRANGIHRTGCGFNFLELNFDTSIVLVSNAYNAIYIDIPKGLIDKLKKQAEFGRGSLIAKDDVFIKLETDVGTIKYCGDARQARAECRDYKIR